MTDQISRYIDEQKARLAQIKKAIEGNTKALEAKRAECVQIEAIIQAQSGAASELERSIAALESAMGEPALAEA